MSILSAGTTNSTALNLTADTSGSLILASNNNVTAVTIAANQNVTFANNATFPTTIGVGGATPSASGSGISFPASQSASSDANTLDDYEEGSWSPTVGGNATYNAQEGLYIKIGQLVFIFFDIGINILGTGSTTTISGVPFTAGNIPNQSSAWTLNPHYFANIANGITWLSAYVPENATTILFVGNSTSATTVQMNGGVVFANGARIVGSGTYRASA